MALQKYKIIYADPPWQYKDQANAGNRGACHKYQVMNLEDIKNLPVQDLVDPEGCLLAMWHVPPMPLEALQVVEAWGFKLKTFKGFTWHKLTKHGKSHFGMGHWTRANTEDCLFALNIDENEIEDCLFATIGKPIRESASVRQFVEAQIRNHSEKPDEVRTRLVELMGDVPRIELFARTQTLGWDVWGNEVESNIELIV